MNGAEAIRILCVDDDQGFVEVVAALLEQHDDTFTTVTAGSTGEGLDRLSATDIHCVVSGYDLPGRNGIEFLEAVRERDPDLPFILFTGNGSEAVASEAISAGVTDCFRRETGNEQYAILANRVRNAVECYRAEQTRDQQCEAIETAEEGIAILDDDGEFVYVDQSFADIYGYEPAELRGEHWEILSPEGAVTFVRDEVLPTARAQGSCSGETTGVRADGTTFPLDQRVVRTERGDLIWSVRDRSERERYESTLTQFRTLVETIDDPVYVLDETGRFEYVNDAFVDKFGYDRDTVLGSKPALIKSPAAVERAESTLGRILSSDGPESIRFEVEIQPREGDSIICEDHMAVLPYDGEQFEGSVGILRDITERKARERELRQQNKRLEEFASVVSHDIRNPLHVADGQLALAREECDSEHLEPVEHALDRIDALIQDLLELARGDEGVSDIGPVELSELARDCWENVDTRDATLITDVDRTLSADETRLKQVIENLVHNAVDHGSDDVTITIGELDGGFYVEDDGRGILEAEHDEVFTAGYSTSDDGTGFGLSIVEQIVEAHGWDVQITTGEDGGARFEITDVAFVDD